MQEAQYEKVELAVPAADANTQALAFVLPILVLYCVPYALLWPEQFSLQALESFIRANGILSLLFTVSLVLVFIVGAVVHELLHGLTWASFCKRGVKSISYGVHWRHLAPYCHCKELLTLRAYLLGGIMPGLVMGLLPALAGMLKGHLLLFLFGLFFTLAASGDLLVLWMLRQAKATDLVQDHPEKIGCYLYREKAQPNG